MRIPPLIAAILIFLPGVVSLVAQAPAPAAAATPRPVLNNGGFETGRVRDDLWTGVDRYGFLAGERASAPVLDSQGNLSFAPMPISVALADMNGDGLLDIVSMDPLGYLRIFFNSGTKDQPTFKNAELSPVFLTRSWTQDFIDPITKSPPPVYLRQDPKLTTFDARRSGKSDIFIGNYWGEVLLLPNNGTGAKPQFDQPTDVSRLAINTSKNPANKWGNLFAPAVWDWNKDGKDDLLLGEGSYSANNIHLLLNTGVPSRPVFEENNRNVLAFGEGREQIVPTVVDYNGDGEMDLLVSDRSGKIGVYLNKGNWKPGVTLSAPFDLLTDAGAPVKFDGITTITTGDLNGDGLFDLIVGKSNGRIAVAYNKGTKTEPKFSAPVELKSTTPSPAIRLPIGWDVDYGLLRGNYYAYGTMVTAADDPQAAPPEGKSALKFGYRPSINTIMAVPTFGQYPGTLDTKYQKLKADPAPREWSDLTLLRPYPANYFLVRNYQFKLKPDQSYTLSFQVKGSGLSNGSAMIGWQATRRLSNDRVEDTGDRGAAKVIENRVDETDGVQTAFSAGSSWNTVTKDFRVAFKDKRLNDPKTEIISSVEIMFSLQPGTGFVYFDDVKITPK